MRRRQTRRRSLLQSQCFLIHHLWVAEVFKTGRWQRRVLWRRQPLRLLVAVELLLQCAQPQLRSIYQHFLGFLRLAVCQ